MMRMHRTARCLSPRAACRLASGLTCCFALLFPGCLSVSWPGRPTVAQSPVRFQKSPSLEQVVAALNANSRPIENIQTQSATLSAPGVPTLGANLTLEPPRRVRLQAGLTGISGTDLDLGGNDELFWMHSRWMQPPAILFARHDDYRKSPARRMLPIEPNWLPEAFGIMKIGPADRISGPAAPRPGHLELRTLVATPSGEMTKITVLDDRYGLILQQNVYDERGQLIATADLSQHRYYPEHDVSLPLLVEMRLPPAQLSFRLEVGEYYINRVIEDPQRRFAMPETGSQAIDLADPRFRLLAPLGN